MKKISERWKKQMCYTKEWFDQKIDKLEDSYFIEKDFHIPNIPHSKSSGWIERKIESILEKQSIDETDVVHILAWKIGKIKHRDSEQKHCFDYACDWKDAEKFSVFRYGKPFCIKKVADYIASDYEELKSLLTDNQIEKAYTKLQHHCPSGIGTVYTITLMYFISGGIIPIYDRFAYKAVKAICTGSKPCEISAPNPPDKNDSQKVVEFLHQYMRLLENVFGTSAITRKQDRALWVYGHANEDFKGESL